MRTTSGGTSPRFRKTVHRKRLFPGGADLGNVEGKGGVAVNGENCENRMNNQQGQFTQDNPGNVGNMETDEDELTKYFTPIEEHAAGRKNVSGRDCGEEVTDDFSKFSEDHTPADGTKPSSQTGTDAKNKWKIENQRCDRAGISQMESLSNDQVSSRRQNYLRLVKASTALLSRQLGLEITMNSHMQYCIDKADADWTHINALPKSFSLGRNHAVKSMKLKWIKGLEIHLKNVATKIDLLEQRYSNSRATNGLLREIMAGII